jgi:DNA-binding Xre family transcriptional regulator
MIRKIGYQWHLRQVMATRNMFQTTDLGAALAERGIHLSREQVYRLVTGTPQRLSLDTLAALCDILDCEITELIEVVAAPHEVAKTGTDSAVGRGATASRKGPRTVVRRPEQS